MADEARVNVVLPAGGEADDNAHRPRRIVLRSRQPRDGRQHGSAHCKMQKIPTVGKFHGAPSQACSPTMETRTAARPPRAGFKIDVWSCLPADGTNAAAEVKGISASPAGSSPIRLHQVCG